MNRRVFLLLAAIALVASACGGDDSVADTTTTVAPPPTTTSAPAATTTTTEPEPAQVVFVGADEVESTITDTSRIVSLSGDITEVIFELGLGANVVAIDVTTTYPPEATDIPGIGFAQMLAPEPVLGMEPTLVIGDQLTSPPEAIQQLRSTGIPVVILESQSTLEGVAVKINQIAEILSVPDAGSALVERVNAEIAEAQALVDEATAAGAEAPRIAFVYSRGPQVLLLFGQGMATNAMIVGAGGIDTAAETGVRGAIPVTPEALVAADPEIIVLPESGFLGLGGEDALDTIPGFSQTTAGQNGAYLVYDEAFFFNLGPRVGQALRQFVQDLYSGS